MRTVLAFLGLAFGISWTVAGSPLFTSLTYLTLRARSVLAPTLLHGSFNVVASLSLVCLTGAANSSSARSASPGSVPDCSPPPPASFTTGTWRPAG